MRKLLLLPLILGIGLIMNISKAIEEGEEQQPSSARSEPAIEAEKKVDPMPRAESAPAMMMGGCPFFKGRPCSTFYRSCAQACSTDAEMKDLPLLQACLKGCNASYNACAKHKPIHHEMMRRRMEKFMPKKEGE